MCDKELIDSWGENQCPWASLARFEKRAKYIYHKLENRHIELDVFPNLDSTFTKHVFHEHSTQWNESSPSQYHFCYQLSSGERRRFNLWFKQGKVGGENVEIRNVRDFILKKRKIRCFRGKKPRGIIRSKRRSRSRAEMGWIFRFFILQHGIQDLGGGAWEGGLTDPTWKRLYQSVSWIGKDENKHWESVIVHCLNIEWMIP
jgi:hypothetical protein